MGTLYNCSWSQYLSSYRFEGESFDGSSSCKNYLGFWHTDSMLLYRGEQFKFVYENGRWSYPNNSGWGNNYVGDYADLAANVTGGAFSSVGESRIQVNTSGYYTFYVHVAQSASGGVSITLTYHCDSTNVPQKNLEEMYVVGKIASVPSCGWPDAVNVTSSCIK